MASANTNREQHDGKSTSSLAELQQLTHQKAGEIVHHERRLRNISEILFRASERARLLDETRIIEQTPLGAQCITDTVQPFFDTLASSRLLQSLTVIAQADPLRAKSIRFLKGIEQLRTGLSHRWPASAVELIGQAERFLEGNRAQSNLLRRFTPLKPFTVAIELHLGEKPDLTFNFWPQNSGGLAVAYAVAQHTVRTEISNLSEQHTRIDPKIWLQIAESIKSGRAEKEFIDAALTICGKQH